MTQSEMRVPGRRPPSFGRTETEGLPQEDFTIRGGESFHLVLHVDVTPAKASLDALHKAIAETTRDAVLAGYAAAFTDMDAAEQPGDGDEGTPAGSTGAEVPGG